MQKHVAGKSINDIKEAETASLCTIRAVCYSLMDQSNGRLAFQLLASVGVDLSREEKQFADGSLAEAESDENVRVNRLIAVLIKGAAQRASISRIAGLQADQKRSKSR
jgi:hypothetical protein